MSGIDKTGKSQTGSDVGAADEAKFAETTVEQKPVETKKVQMNELVSTMLGDNLPLYMRAIANAGRDAVERAANMINMATGPGGDILGGAMSSSELVDMAYPESKEFYGKDYGELFSEPKRQMNVETHQGVSKKEIEDVASKVIHELMEATGESEAEVKEGLSGTTHFLVYPSDETRMDFAFHLYDFKKAADGAGQSLGEAYQIYKDCKVSIDEACRDRLDILNLSGRQISHLPPEIVRFAGRQLLLNNNSLQSFSTDFSWVRSNLESVDLSNNRLTSLSSMIGVFSGAGRWWVKDQTLRNLNLSNNQLKTLPRDIALFAGKTFHVSLDNNPLEFLPSEVSVALFTIATGLYGPTGSDPNEADKMRLYFGKFGTLFPTDEQIQSLEKEQSTEGSDVTI
ncbi:MAG: leucine-rich repeat domain-containing protein [Alphaproteobacteria bacterium]|jgi:hypothetical protein|nr:leucine-rich repeat domain-containing protein [Alphaproteobacteria bacterium]MBP9877751.1 leucine-rich repeat domain-containing protein [Alphaproteobacteria bacterium]